jgi:hypothetical protein
MNFNTVTVWEVEAQVYIEGKGHDNYISARSTVMSRSIKTAYRLAREEVRRSMGRQSIYGGVPVLEVVTINGVEYNN